MSDQTAEASKFLPSLENAVTRKYFFLLAAYTLWVDSALLRIQGQGLLDYAQSPEGLKSSFALAVFLLFVLFSFLMTLVMPPLLYFMDEVVLNLVWSPLVDFWSWLVSRLGFERSVHVDNDTGPGRGYVRLHELSKKAHATREAYYLDLLKLEVDQRAAERQADYITRFFAGSTLMMATYNFCFQNAHSLLNRCADFLGDRGWGWALLLLIAANTFGFLFASYKASWVYCPPLWEELRDAKRKDHLAL